MKSSVATALLAYASAITDETTLMQQPLQHSLTDETSLMQQQSQRSMNNKLSVSSDAQSSRGESTAKLLESAVSMMKNGVTPDVITFVDATNQDIDESVLVAIQDEHNEDQTYINGLCQDFENAVEKLREKAAEIAVHASTSQSHQETHHSCRAEEAYKCARSRRCEEQLRTKWVSVRHEESRMREIHGHIHEEWCVHPPFFINGNEYPENADTPQETPSTPPEIHAWLSHHPFNWAQTSPYPILDLPQDVIDFRSVSKIHFEEYREQKIVVERVWEEYNEKLEECATLEEDWEAEMPICDAAQNTARESACRHATDNRAARQEFGQEWNQTLTLFNEARTAKAANQAARKNEWETLKIVQCLLNHVHSSVINSIETGGPCPTIDSDPEGVTLAIEDCHIVTRGCDYDSMTHHLCLTWCDPPDVPELPPVEEPACTPMFVAREQSAFLAAIQASYTDRLLAPTTPAYPNDPLTAYETELSDAGWAGCAPPLVCVDCDASVVQGPVSAHTRECRDPALDPELYPQPGKHDCICHLHEEYLSPGQSNQDTFRCLDGTCISQAGRCNGHSNCHDGSDESGCDADSSHFVPAYLSTSFACPADFHDDVHFTCRNERCIEKVGMCNGIDNCGDGSDENNCRGHLKVTAEATSGRTITVEALSAGMSVFHDRRYNLDSLGHFAGKTIVKYSNDDKAIDHEHVMTKLRALEPLTVYILKLDARELPNMPWLETEGYEETSLTGVSFSGVRDTPHKEWDASLLTTDHFAASAVWSKTFAAGTISIPGNNGGHGGFLIFLDRPSAEHHSPPHTLPTTAAPVTEPEPDPNCGPLPDLTNAQWAGGLEYHCMPGFSFDGSAETTGFALEIECFPNGHYTPVRACMPINDCLVVHHECGAFGTCRDLPMDYTCDCESGFEMHIDEQSGEKICGNIDDCQGHNCGPAGVCHDLVNDYECSCGTGWTHAEDDVKTCERVECGQLPHVDNVLEVEASGLFPWTRAKAVFEEVVDLTCKSDYSTNGERNGPTTFSMTCQANGEYSAAQQCLRVPAICPSSRLMTSLTASAPAHEPSHVWHEGESVTYTCNPGHHVANTGATTFQVACLESGTFSSMSTCRNIDDCEEHSCGSNGRCVDGINDFTCDCEDGFEEEEIDGEPMCGNSVCGGGGTSACGGHGVCHDLGNGLGCDCDPGYEKQVNSDNEENCVAITCAMPAFDFATLEENSLSFGQSTSVNCDQGYDVGGGQTAFNVQCKADGSITVQGSNLVSLPQCSPTPVTISGRVKNALDTSRVIPGATLEIAGQSVTSDGGGRFSVVLAPGRHTYSLMASGFITVSAGVMNVNSAANENDIIMSPELGPDEWRIVLTWNEFPTDLDSHLQFPGESCSQMMYNNPHASCHGVSAKLDRDDVNSYGPETTTLSNLNQCDSSTHTCKWVYKVKNYSGWRRSDSNHHWTASQAVVTLYHGNTEAGRYEVDSDAGHKPSENSEFWSVLSIDAAGNVVECNNAACN